jgi:hypothetical protein
LSRAYYKIALGSKLFAGPFDYRDKPTSCDVVKAKKMRLGRL